MKIRALSVLLAALIIALPICLSACKASGTEEESVSEDVPMPEINYRINTKTSTFAVINDLPLAVFGEYDEQGNITKEYGHFLEDVKQGYSFEFIYENNILKTLIYNDYIFATDQVVSLKADMIMTEAGLISERVYEQGKEYGDVCVKAEGFSDGGLKSFKIFYKDDVINGREYDEKGRLVKAYSPSAFFDISISENGENAIGKHSINKEMDAELFFPDKALCGVKHNGKSYELEYNESLLMCKASVTEQSSEYIVKHIYELKYSSAGKVNSITESGLDKNGAVKYKVTIDYEYYSNGCVSKFTETWEFEDGTQEKNSSEFEYNENGRQIKRTFFRHESDGSKIIESVNLTEYDTAGNVKKLIFQGYTVNGDKSSSVVYEYDYDEKGDLTTESEAEYKANGTLEYKIVKVKEYKDKGILSKETRTSYNSSMRITSKYVALYEYDEEGRVSKSDTTYYIGEKTFENRDVYIWEYNIDGTVKNETYIQYDANGNVIG